MVAVHYIVGRKIAEAFVEDSHIFALPAGIYVIDNIKVVVR